MDFYDRLHLQQARHAAYKDGVYELDEWEGFTCTECGDRLLTATVNLEDGLESFCRSCGGAVETSGEDTDWDAVEEKLPEEYLTGEAMETGLPTCPACRSDIKEDAVTVTWTVGEKKATVHKRCAEGIWEQKIENPRWYDTFTPEHYEAAADYLRSFDSVGCVITHGGTAYMGGEMYVHTNYCTTSLVRDVLDAFNGRVVAAGIAREDDEHEFDCTTEEHGTCFEILIDFCKAGAGRMPPEYLNKFKAAPREDGSSHRVSQDYFITKHNEPVFDADFSATDEKPSERVPKKYR